MASGGELFRKTLLKKDKLDLVKMLKAKNQPTNGGKAELVDRILAYDEKSGGKLSRAAVAEEEAPPPDADGDGDENEEEEEEAKEETPAAKPKPKPKPKKKKSTTGDDGEREGGGGGGGAPINCGDCGDCGGCQPSCNYGSGLGFAAQIFTAIAALCQLILGIIQFSLMAELLENVCVSEVAGFDTGYDCVGEALIWDAVGADETSSGLNATWRTVFTLRPSFFFTNWTPMLFGVIAIMQCFSSTSWDFISGTWLRCMLFHVFMLLFAAMGYCGQAGIVVGFIEALAGLMCLVMAIATRCRGGGTYPTFQY